MQKIFIVFCLVLFIVLGGILYTRSNKVFVTELATNTIETAFYNIKITQPKNAQKNYPELFAVTRDTVIEFEKNYGHCDEDCEQQISNNLPYELLVDTKIATTSKTVSYIVSLYEYAGGAHGSTVIKTFTYDSKKRLIDENKFFGENDWRPVVSGLTYQHLKEKLKDLTTDEALKEGTAPIGDNLSTWYLKDNGIVFIFGQYQIGAYALGIQEVEISIEKLSTVISNKYK